MFKSLSSRYSTQLTERTHKSLGFDAVKKGDFFLMFWAAWTSSFTPERSRKSFEATGIWPRNSEAVLKRFHPSTPDEDRTLNNSPTPDGTDWRKVRSLIHASVKVGAEKQAQELIQIFHHLQVQNELITQENRGLKEAAQIRKKHKKKGVPLDLQQRQEYHGGAVLWSPRKVREARTRRSLLEQAEADEKLEKARRKKEQEDKKIHKQLELEQRRVERERLKKEREKEKEKKAQKVALRKQQKQEERQATDARKIAQQSQTIQSTALKKATPKRKRVEECTGSASGDQGAESSQAPPPKTTRTGRSITIPRKFR
jgi:hypothetical protein